MKKLQAAEIWRGTWPMMLPEDTDGWLQHMDLPRPLYIATAFILCPQQVSRIFI